MNGKIRLTPQQSTRMPELDSRNVTRFCPKCGREIPLDRSECAYCGNSGTFHAVPRPNGKKLRTVILIAMICLFLLAFSLYLTRHTGLI